MGATAIIIAIANFFYCCCCYYYFILIAIYTISVFCFSFLNFKYCRHIAVEYKERWIFIVK